MDTWPDDKVPPGIMTDTPRTRFSEISENDLDLLREGLLHRLPHLANAILEETDPGAEGASFGVLADAVRIIQELDVAIAVSQGRPIIDIDHLKDVRSSEDLRKMYDQRPF
jgi:hypothetical protein